MFCYNISFKLLVEIVVGSNCFNTEYSYNEYNSERIIVLQCRVVPTVQIKYARNKN